MISVKRVVGETSIYEVEGEVLENVQAATAPMLSMDIMIQMFPGWLISRRCKRCLASVFHPSDFFVGLFEGIQMLPKEHARPEQAIREEIQGITQKLCYRKSLLACSSSLAFHHLSNIISKNFQRHKLVIKIFIKDKKLCFYLHSILVRLFWPTLYNPWKLH